jgi:hypothetical protein
MNGVTLELPPPIEMSEELPHGTPGISDEVTVNNGTPDPDLEPSMAAVAQGMARKQELTPLEQQQRVMWPGKVRSLLALRQQRHRHRSPVMILTGRWKCPTGSRNAPKLSVHNPFLWH